MSDEYHNDILFTKEQFDQTMARRKYIIQAGQVVCSTCYSECGQCGEGWWMWKCQEYLDAQPLAPRHPYTQRAVGSIVLVALACIVIFIVRCAFS